jgi:hypothetical protein
MIAIRYAALMALVFWVGGMAGNRFGEPFRQVHLLAYVCGAVIIVCLFVMKFVGPPPHGFIPRVALVALMLAIAIGSRAAVQLETSTALMTVNIALGLVLLFWYVRE